ncbi:unnamed protein product [Dovyalis caffra]|uniref:Uncharacterized protein n=1 Tax=Dovyalis caffra TaxID=77055 RepID=A0AAV1QVG6_9ROSI|nr:unnamed protein product [Dovyalis caffra]
MCKSSHPKEIENKKYCTRHSGKSYPSIEEMKTPNGAILYALKGQNVGVLTGHVGNSKETVVQNRKMESGTSAPMLLFPFCSYAGRYFAQN